MGLAHRIGVLVVLLGLLPSGASAGDEESFTRSGFYVGVGGSYVTDTFEGALEDALDVVIPGITVDVEPSAGVNAVVGYRLLPFLAMEADYEWIDEFNVSFFGTDAFGFEAHSLTGNLKWILPTSRVQPYLVTGIGFTSWKIVDKVGLGVSESTTDLAGRLGLGLDVYVTEHVVVTARTNAVLSATDLSVGGQKIEPIFYVGGQAGLQYRF